MSRDLNVFGPDRLGVDRPPSLPSDYESDGFARSNMGDVERVKWAIDWAEENLQ